MSLGWNIEKCEVCHWQQLTDHKKQIILLMGEGDIISETVKTTVRHVRTKAESEDVLMLDHCGTSLNRSALMKLADFGGSHGFSQ